VPSSKPALAYVLTGNNTISSFTVNSCTGDLTPTNPASVSANGNQFGAEDMAVDPSGRFLYVANLMSNATDLATIAMFTINSTTGVLTPTTPPTVATGFFPQGIGIDPSGKFVYTANSDDNTVSMFTVNQNTGVLTPTTPPTVAAGWSPGSVTVDPSGRFAYVTNQIDDTVSMYTIDSVTGVLTPMTPATVPTGGAPFAVTIDPSGKFAYVPNAYDVNNAVSEYTVDSATGVLTPTSQGFATAGDSPTFVAVDPGSKFAYVVNRMAKTVSAYSINPSSGDLVLIGSLAAGSQPWRSAVDPSGQFVYVADEGGAILIYTINRDGSLTSAGTTATGGGAYKIAVIAPK
jgi:6-phosphogluconolactonase (cycloisomerase 2 family)